MKHFTQICKKTGFLGKVGVRGFARKQSSIAIKKKDLQEPDASTVDQHLLESYLSSDRVMDVFERMNAREKKERSLILMTEIFKIMKKKEMMQYSVNHQILHLLTKMGYYIKENRDGREGHRLIKKTENLEIEIYYSAKQNKSNELESVLEAFTQNLNHQTFGQFRKKFGNLVDPGMDLYERNPEYPNPAIKNPEAVKLGHDRFDDVTDFEIMLRKGENVMFFLCWSHNGDIHIKHIFCGDPQTSDYKGPTFNTLSKKLQTQLLHYLYSVGVYPDVALCVEYLALNKQQRLYMRWVEQFLKYAKQEKDAYNQ